MYHLLLIILFKCELGTFLYHTHKKKSQITSQCGDGPCH